MRVKNAASLLALILCVQFLAVESSTVNVFAPFESNSYTFGSCSCLQNYTCTSSTNWNGIAKFKDPIPSGITASITAVQISMKGDPFCNANNNLFHLNLYLNDIQLNPLIQVGAYNCYCHCFTVANQTSFSELPNYKRGEVNTIKTTVIGNTIACFEGYEVTLIYNTAPPPPSPPPPAPSSTPIPHSGYSCCVYAGGPGGAYDVTCTANGICNDQVGYTTITKYPVSSCSECFN